MIHCSIFFFSKSAFIEAVAANFFSFLADISGKALELESVVGKVDACICDLKFDQVN